MEALFIYLKQLLQYKPAKIKKHSRQQNEPNNSEKNGAKPESPMRCFVMEGDHAKAKSQSAAQSGKDEKYLFGDSAKSAFGTKFICTAKHKNSKGGQKRCCQNSNRQEFQQYPLRKQFVRKIMKK